VNVEVKSHRFVICRHVGTSNAQDGLHLDLTRLQVTAPRWFGGGMPREPTADAIVLNTAG
jgi:hypothetical protein